MWTVKKHLLDSRRIATDGFYIAHPVVCKDGFAMSVQHSAYHYCAPKVSFAERRGLDFDSYEVGFPSETEDILLFFAEDSGNPTETVYAYVPAQIVEQVAEMHGGIFRPSGELWHSWYNSPWVSAADYVEKVREEIRKGGPACPEGNGK